MTENPRCEASGPQLTEIRRFKKTLATEEGLVKNLDDGTAPLCPGEYGREALEIAIGLRESHRRGGEKIELPLADRRLKMLA